MAMTPKQRKEVSIRMKKYWAKRREEMLDKQDALLQEMRDEQTGISSYMKGDLVNHPPHYTFGKYEVVYVLQDWFPNEPLLWNATKYLPRWDKKGDPIENLEKAVWYINKKIEQLKGT